MNTHEHAAELARILKKEAEGTIYISREEEESWLISIRADSDDARVLRNVFADAAREGGWTGPIVWNWKRAGFARRSTNDYAAAAMDRARRAVNRVTEDMFARQHREASK
jgi:hypothetical protein